jgi:hypothetical protein
MFCRSLLVLVYFFFWVLCCLFIFDLRILITSLLYPQILHWLKIITLWTLDFGLWNNLEISVRNSSTLSLFKHRVKDDTYRPPEYYNEGPRKLNILHTRLRHKYSSLNTDLSRIHVINNNKCNCGGSFEDAIHYFLECPLYPNERRTLLSDCDDVNIIIETLIFGNDDNSYDVNSKIFGKVRTFINQSKQF